MKKLIILVTLVYFCFGCSSLMEVPLDEGCHFEYITLSGDSGTAKECLLTKVDGAGIQIFCGDDENLSQVIEYKTVCNKN